MKKDNEKKGKHKGKSKRFSARASLIAIGQYARRWKFFSVIKEKVTIAQKVVKHTPIEKLTDAFVCINKIRQGNMWIEEQPLHAGLNPPTINNLTKSKYWLLAWNAVANSRLGGKPDSIIKSSL